MSSMDEKALGRRLQAARQAAGFTQQSLCQKAGLSYSTLAKIERGAIKTPSIFTIQRIAAVLGVTLDALVGTPPPAAKRREHSKSGIGFVYFDVNDCLVQFYHRAFTHIAADADVPADVPETLFWHYNDQICRGDMTMAEFNRTLGGQLRLPGFDWTAYYLESTEPTPGMAELVAWAAKRYGIGLLTNSMPGMVDRLREQHLLPDVQFDVIIDSSEAHQLKPERAIYDLALERSGCRADELLFVDDSRTNIMAAERLGWHVLHFESPNPEESIMRIRSALEPAV